MWFLAIRQLLSRPQQTFFTFIAILMGAATYIVFTGLMLGFRDFLLAEMVDNDGHILITPRDDRLTPSVFESVFFGDTTVKWLTPPSGRRMQNELTNIPLWFRQLSDSPEVVAFSPRYTRQVLFRHGTMNQAATLTGIRLTMEDQVSNFSSDIKQGDVRSLAKGQGSLVLGSGLAESLGVRLGNSIRVVTTDGGVYNLVLKAIFSVGVQQIDDTTAYTSLATAQKIHKAGGQITSIAVKTVDYLAADELAARWAEHSTDKIQSWDKLNENTLSVFQIQDVTRHSIIYAILIMIAFGIYNILNMVVNQKKQEIAILRSIGYDRRDIIKLFVAQGLLLGLAGSIMGMVVGALGLWFLDNLEVGPRSIGTDSTMLIAWHWWVFASAGALTVLFAVVASVIPARMASKLSPIDVIRGAR